MNDFYSWHLWLLCSVTRFGKISLLWQKFDNFFKVYLLFGKFWIYFVKIVMHLGKFWLLQTAKYCKNNWAILSHCSLVPNQNSRPPLIKTKTMQGEGLTYGSYLVWLGWILPNKKIGCRLEVGKLLNSNQSNWKQATRADTINKFKQ